MGTRTKSRVSELAVVGGPRAFEAPLHVGKPNLGDRAKFLDRLNAALDRAWLTNDGPLLQEFEQAVRRHSGARHAIAINNATVALEILVRAADLKGEVILPSFTFVATAHAVEWMGLTPVFCDVRRDDFTIDAEQVEALITPRTSAIMGVHLWGQPCRVDALEALARRHRLRLFFDAAHAFGCTAGARPVGSLGDAEVFSFHATKFVNAFEGGAITTNDDELARRCRLMRNFGFTGYDAVAEVGTNGKMNEACAAMGVTSLESMEAVMKANRANHRHYREELRSIPGLSVHAYDPSAGRQNHQYVICLVDPRYGGAGRDRLIEILKAENVLARRYFHPGCHGMEPYRSRDPSLADRLPVTVDVASRVIALPTGPTVSTSDIEVVASILRVALEHGSEVGILARDSQPQ